MIFVKMINFYLQFLVCFSKPIKPDSFKKKSATKAPLSKKKKKIVNESKHEETLVQKNVNIIECTEKVREWCHLEYCLLEDVLPKVEIDVVTWGAAAKVYTKDEYRALKTVIIDNFVWVYFVVVHKIHKLNNEEVVKLKDSTITFLFSQSQSNMMDVAVNDWPREFDICGKVGEGIDQSSKWFAELRQTDPVDKTHKDALKERAERFESTQPQRNSIVSILQLMPCDDKVVTKVLDLMQSLSEERESLMQVEKVLKKKQPQKKNIKEEKTTSEDALQLFIKADQLIAGKSNVCVEQKFISASLKYVGVIANSTKIMTEDQEDAYVPFSVTIETIEALPLSFLEKFKVKKVYARYELADVLSNVETTKVDVVGDKITVNDTQLSFISSAEERDNHKQLMLRPSILRLVEALTTRRLVVKLYGERDTTNEEVVEPCLFGERPTDQYISTPGHGMFLQYKQQTLYSELFLGSASFNLISLAKGLQQFETSSVLTSNPVSTWDPARDTEELLESTRNNDDRDAVLARFTTKGLLPEPLLIEMCTRITVKVSVGCLLTNLSEHQLLLMPNIFHRIIVIFNDHHCAKNLFLRISKVNNLLGEPYSTSSTSTATLSTFIKSSTVDRSFSSLLASCQIRQSRALPSVVSQIRQLKRSMSSSLRALTGFYIESEDDSILVVEGIPFVFPYVVEPIHALLPSDGRAIYDSSLFFSKKLYEDFYPTNIFKISLRLPLGSILKKSTYYLDTSPPEDALSTLLLLDLLRRSRTLNDACIHQLFPSSNQLIKFNKVFGLAPSFNFDPMEVLNM